MNAANFPLSNAQLELLKLFSRDIDESDLKEIKRLIVRYLASKLSEQTNKVWEEKNWSNEDMENFLKTHMRTKYKDSK